MLLLLQGKDETIDAQEGILKFIFVLKCGNPDNVVAQDNNETTTCLLPLQTEQLRELDFLNWFQKRHLKRYVQNIS
jgi:hypothetical protein